MLTQLLNNILQRNKERKDRKEERQERAWESSTDGDLTCEASPAEQKARCHVDEDKLRKIKVFLEQNSLNSSSEAEVWSVAASELLNTEHSG